MTSSGHSESPFLSTANQEVVPDTQDAPDELPGQKVDIIYGLYLTAEFKKDIGALDDLRHAPFRGAEHPMYPFLIISANDGDGTAGFTGIEDQSAFPLRTCLMLQEKLRKARRNDFIPLVWFLSYQEDIWRVCACIVNEGGMV